MANHPLRKIHDSLYKNKGLQKCGKLMLAFMHKYYMWSNFGKSTIWALLTHEIFSFEKSN